MKIVGSSHLAAILLTLVASVAAADVPPWVHASASPGAETAAAVVLLDDVAVVVDREGRVRTTKRYVVRIIGSEGKRAATVRQVYIDGAGRIAGLKAWVLPANGPAREYGGRETFEAALVDNDLYNEIRIKGIDASGDIEPGTVFAAEVESEERGLFAQLDWPLQDRWPSRAVRRTLTVPPGWTARSVTFNASPIEPTVAGSTYRWEARNLPELHEEAAAPPVSSLVPRVAVSYFAPSGSRTPGQFESWSDVGAWLQAISAESVDAADPLARTARDVIGHATSELDKIRAIAQFVQRVQYVSIQTGLGRGGGYQPRPAAQTLEKRYGDCKDKASLMRALLSAVGIKAYLVAIYSGDPRYVREEWPSPQQFNHCIIAIVLTQPADLGSLVTHAVYGRLLFFDPTDERGRVGELPIQQQGSLALLQVANASLVRVPSMASAEDRVDRSVDASVASTGELQATIIDRAFGRAAAAARARAAAISAADLRRTREAAVAALAAGATLVRHTADDPSGDGPYVVTLETRAPGYAQLMQGRLMLVRPPARIGLDTPLFMDGTRRYAIDLEKRHALETITIHLPQEFGIDELPPAATLESPYGRFTMTVERSAEGAVVSRRQFELQRALVPASEYTNLRTFFDRVRAAASAPIVLVKK